MARDRPSRTRVLIAVAISVFGVAFAASRLRFSWVTSSQNVPIIATEDQVALSAAVTAPVASEVEVRSVVAGCRDGWRRAVSALSADAALDGARLERLLEVASARLSLYLAPDYEQYLVDVEMRTGRSRESIEQSTEVFGRSDWESVASRYSFRPVDATVVKVRPKWIRGIEVPSPQGGHQAVRRDVGLYNTQPDPEKAKADVYEVMVAMELEPYLVSEDGALRSQEATVFYLVLAFMWTPERRDWLPFRASVYDPTNREFVLIAPWI